MDSDKNGIRLFVLGTPRVNNALSRQVRLQGRKSMALLAYLVTTAPRVHPREHLASLFWPSLNTKDARNNLRVTLARTLRSLANSDEPCILADRQSLRLNTRATLWSDITELYGCSMALSAIVSGSSVPDVTAQMHHEIVLEHYQGDFLSGLHLDGCMEFEAWVMETREHCRARATRLFDHLAECQQNAGNLPSAERMTRRVLSLDALYEPAHKRLMQLLAQQDLRHCAIQHFAYFKNLLQAELGVLPDSDTMDLLAAIEAGAWSPGLHNASDAAA